MDTTLREKENLRTIIRALIWGDTSWLKKREILWGDKPPFWILNYRPGGRNEYNRLTRGLVIHQPPAGFHIAWRDPLPLIASFPFIRFFNKNEKEADEVDFSNADMLEKMDGTMVGVFFPAHKRDDFPVADCTNPHWHTRKMLSTHKPDMDMVITGFHGGSYRFMPLIGQAVRELDFNFGNVSFTYVFEFIHEASSVLTKYTEDQYGLYLLGARNLTEVYGRMHCELTEPQLDHVASCIGAKRPRRWDAIESEEEIRRMMCEEAEELPNFEGYVFRDRETGKRIKVKDEEYLKKHRLIASLSIKNLIPIFLMNETEEIVAYFPHAKENLDLIAQRFNEYVNNAADAIMDFLDRALTEGWNRKTLAAWAGGSRDQGGVGSKFIFTVLMRLYGEIQKANAVNDHELFFMGAEVRDHVRLALMDIALGKGKGKGKNVGSPKRLAEMLGFGKEVEDVPDVEM